ncbi:uncharacterized protein TM35_000024590 [Trypanosoma theileri]|uniref:Uncharacterized protein n=1 Tax=Trypanosoma theileri TaxID=67003 RepID=A0A1X0P928_9TRYP|nr:uncharacterized protein TM35_000024590 [Trypanosoma theileri]ORC93133.1 hypothetical protein TM35_000024590 [Trypanosoma theileri]
MGGKVAKPKFQPLQSVTSRSNSYYKQKEQQKTEQNVGSDSRNTISNGDVAPTGSSSPSLKNDDPRAPKRKSFGTTSSPHSHSGLQKEERWATVTPAAAAAMRETQIKIDSNVELISTICTDGNEVKLDTTNTSGSPKTSSRRVAFLPDKYEEPGKGNKKCSRKVSYRSSEGDIVIVKRVPQALCSAFTVAATIDENDRHSPGFGDIFDDDIEYILDDDDDSIEQIKADSKDSDDEANDSICKHFSYNDSKMATGRQSVATSGVALGDRSVGGTRTRSGTVDGGGGGRRRRSGSVEASNTLKNSNSKSRNGKTSPGRYITSAKLNQSRLIGTMSSHKWIYQWLKEVVLPEGPDIVRVV